MGTVSVTAPEDGGEPAAMMPTVALVRRLVLRTERSLNPADTSLQPATTAVTESSFLC